MMNCDTGVPLTQPASSSSRKLASFAQRFRLELNQKRKQEQVSLEDCILADLPRDDRLSRPLLCDVPFVLASSAEVGIGSGEKYRPAEMDTCSALMSLGGTSKPIEQQNVSGLSSSRLLVHFSTPRSDSFPLSVAHSSERMVATRVGLLEDEQDSFVPGGGLLIEVDQDLPTKVDQESDVSHRELCIAHTGLARAVHETVRALVRF